MNQGAEEARHGTTEPGTDRADAEAARPGAGPPASDDESPAGERGGGLDFDVSRLRVGDLVAVVAAFALLFIMAGDWYSTNTGEEAREIVRKQGTEEPGAGLIDEGAAEDARVEAEQAERNAWNVASVFDVLVVIGLLAAIGLALAAAALRAAGREYPEPRRSPGALAALAALAALLLVLLQAAVRLDPDSDATTEIGLPLGIAALGAIAFGAAYALRETSGLGEGTAVGETREEPADGRA
jgi:drug/metabolite transporter (DMT)-like permease